MKTPVSMYMFWGIFSNGQLLLSNLNGMAFLFDSREEAAAQMKHLRKAWPKTAMKVVQCNIHLPEGK